NAFLFPWGHMTVTLEDVARITGLRVHGDPVTGTTLSDYREVARDLLGYEDLSPGPLRSLRGSALTELLGAKGVSKTRGGGMDEYIARVRDQVGGRWAQEDGVPAQRQLRAFLLFILSRVLFATKSSRISLRFLTVLEDLEAVGQYAWGAAVLADLFYNLSTHSGETGISGFSPLLQVHILNFFFIFCTIFEFQVMYSDTESASNLSALLFHRSGHTATSPFTSLTSGEFIFPQV